VIDAHDLARQLVVQLGAAPVDDGLEARRGGVVAHVERCGVGVIAPAAAQVGELQRHQVGTLGVVGGAAVAAFDVS